MAKNGHTGVGTDDTPISGDEVFGRVDDALRKSLKEAAEAERLGAKPEKFFGMEMDAPSAIIFKGLYNSTADFAASTIAPKTNELSKRALSWMGVASPAAARAGALMTFAVSAGLKGGIYFQKIFETIMQHRDVRTELARKLAPVLDEIKGRHTTGALMSVSIEENSMIYAHRKRLAKIAHNENVGNLIDLAFNAGPNLLLDAKIPHAALRGDSEEQLHAIIGRVAEEHAQHQAQRELNPHHPSLVPNGALGRIGMIVNTAGAGLSNLIKNKNSTALKALPLYSALDMVFSLEKQVANKPDARSFRVEGSKGKEDVALEVALVRIVQYHQKELADLDPEYSEIRDALKEDLLEAVKPIAKALRSGDLSAMALVTLIGGGHIIKSQGRGVASPAEVDAEIERMSGHSAHLVHQDPKDYYRTANFTPEDLKKMFCTLEGEERLVAACWFPDAVLEQAGLSASEVKQLRESSAKEYARRTLEVFMGVVTKSDADLHEEGLAKSEIKQLREAEKYLERNGIDSFRQLMESPANTHGVERLIANLAVPQICGDKHYLGRLIEAGREKLATQDHCKGDKADKSHGKPPKTDGEYVKNAADHGHRHNEHETVRDLHRTENDYPKHHISGRPQHQGKMHGHERHMAG